MERVRIGCSGWSYDDWRGGLYPQGLPPRRRLERYAEVFDTVEVNATFYRLPKEKTVRDLTGQVPGDIRFAVKSSRYLTHMKRLHDIADAVARFWEPLEPLRRSRKLGPVLWQLPENFERDDDLLAAALDRLPPADHCFEFRHPSWFAPPVRRLLAERGASLAIGMYFQPFSPRWLVGQGRDDEAREVLRRARDSDDEVEEELKEIEEEEASAKGSLRDLFAPGVRAMVVIGLVMAIAQQLIGVNTVIYYAPTILKLTGLSTTSAITQALSVGITNVIFTIVAILILDKVGRRPLLIVGTIGCVVALTARGVFFASSTLKQDAPGIALVCLIVYIASFAVGLGPVFWLMISEIFPLKVRSAAMSVSTVANWAANFVVSTFFLTLTGAITVEGTFWLYAGFGVAAIVFFVFRLPETKSRSLEEISDEVTDEAVT